MAGQVGFVTETVYGTGVAVTKFMPVLSANPGGGVPERLRSEGIAGSRRTRRPGRGGRVSARPTLRTELYNEGGIATLLKHCFGGVATAGAGPYTHTFTPGAHLGKSMTVQVGIMDAADTTQPFTATGVKVESWTLAVDNQGFATLDVGMVAQNVVTGTALAVASYDADAAPFTFVECSVSADGTPIASARSFSLTMTKNLAAERYTVGTPYIREPLESGYFDVTGTIDADFEDLDMFNHALALDEVSIVAVFDNGPDSLTVTMNTQITGDPPQLDSPGLQSQTINFEAGSGTSDADTITAVLVNSEASAA